MKKRYLNILKNWFRSQLLSTREMLHLTQPPMARKLFMEERSYAALESGESGCSALTLALFLIYCCKDPLACLESLRIAFEKAADHAA